ncbi:hypothetical protein ACIQD3_23540 [Peribacillus loiseleuriae]|uniref:hypothetical protein n=1 Tax=Peribacillus loiseleuriae TaxID=1679170 RepID=UPI0037F6ACFA
MIKVVNDVEVLLADERREFVDQVFILAYRDENYFHKLILVDLRMVAVVGQDEPSWIYVIKQVDYQDYCSNRESYAAVVCEIHNRVRPYLEESYGKFGRCILADHEHNVYGQPV